MSTQRSTERTKDGSGRLNVGVLIDLAPTPEAGGHVKVWQRLADAAVERASTLDLTIHFLGEQGEARAIADNVRYQIHKPIFSTANLRFLPYVPAHTDLWPYHRGLAACLRSHQVIHTTNGCFSFARTAESVGRKCRIPLVNSMHTDTAGYTEVFTAQFVEELLGRGGPARLVLDRWQVAARMGAAMRRRLNAHQRQCAFVLASKPSDAAALSNALSPGRVSLLRRGLQHHRFNPGLRDRAWLERSHGLSPQTVVLLFVGRLDRSKQFTTLVEAAQALVAEGLPLQLVTAGEGPEGAIASELLGARVTHLGLRDQQELARVYASADMLALPSLLDETSNVVLEALASGLPVLVAEASGRLVVDGESGVVVRGDGVGPWVEALRGLIIDEQRRQRLGRAARQFAEHAVPSWPAVLDEDLMPVWQRAAAAVSSGT